ncbi:MAG: hypothetical protein WBY94_28055 [Polyangiaceae bacterium]
MIRLTPILPKCARAVILGAVLVTSSSCGVEVGAAYPGPYDDSPPDAYFATATPVYFEGRASYWYGGRWYYRDGGRWRHYDREPAGLYQRRMMAAPGRRTYEPSHGRSVRPAPAPRGRGGEHH